MSGASRRTLAFDRQAHGSTPIKGINALEHMAGFITEATRQLTPQLQQRQNQQPVVPPEASAASLAFTVIQSGTNVNSVLDTCVVAFDRRLVTGESLADARQELWQVLEHQARTIPDFRYEYKERYAAAPTWVSAETPLVQAFSANHLYGARTRTWLCVQPGN